MHARVPWQSPERVPIESCLYNHVTLSVVEESPERVHFDCNNVIAKGNVVMIFVGFCPLSRRYAAPSPRGRRLFNDTTRTVHGIREVYSRYTFSQTVTQIIAINFIICHLPTRAETGAKDGNKSIKLPKITIIMPSLFILPLADEGTEWYRLGQLGDMPRREFTKRK